MADGKVIRIQAGHQGSVQGPAEAKWGYTTLNVADWDGDGMLDLVPAARVAHIGMYRDHDTLEPIEYYFKAPGELENRLIIVVDPMLATGNSIVAAVTRIKQTGARHIKFVCLLAAPEGIRTLTAAHPDVEIYTPAIDERLDDHGYIVPGLGDAGDRLFGTK